MSHRVYDQSRHGETTDDELMEWYDTLSDCVQDAVQLAAEDLLNRIKARNTNKVGLHIGPALFIPLVLRYYASGGDVEKLLKGLPE
jgi:hypothetical protein